METRAYRPSMDSRAFDFEQDTESSQAAPYSFGRQDFGHQEFGNQDLGRQERADYSSHDPIPLFLSDPESEPDPREFAPTPARSKTGTAARIFAGVLAAAAVAVVVTLYQSDIAGMFVDTAKASLGGGTTEQAAAAAIDPKPVVRPIPLKDPARVSNPMMAYAEARDIAPSPPPKPSREAIATAYQTALQSQATVAVAPPPPLATVAPPPPVAVAAPVAAVAPAPSPAIQAAPVLSAPAPAATTLDAETMAGLMSRAQSLLAVGDIAAARLLLERAAHAQNATAAFLLAQTYDPAVLGTNDIRSITADPAAARNWYQKAAQLGSPDARQRLTQLQN